MSSACPPEIGRIAKHPVVALLVAGAASVAFAVPASAFVAAKTVDVMVHKFAVGSATAVCPSGRHVSMGGIVAQYQAPGAGGKHILATGMRRTADDRWTVSGFNLSKQREGHLTAVAYCASGSVPPRWRAPGTAARPTTAVSARRQPARRAQCWSAVGSICTRRRRTSPSCTARIARRRRSGM